MSAHPPHNLVIGRLSRDFILPPSGRPYLDMPGGSALYAAAGLALWESRIGIVGRVGSDYPVDWLDQLAQWNFNTRGIRFLTEPYDLRRFAAYSEDFTRHIDNPVAHFARRGLAFPRSLLNYVEESQRLDSTTRLTPLSVRQADLPGEYLHATAAHLCGLDYLSHSLMPAVLRQASISILTLEAGKGYMDPTFWHLLPAILTGLTAFLTSAESLRALFQGRSTDIWEMTEALGAYGCDLIVVKTGENGQLLYDSAGKHRWEIPAYPARVVDPTGAGDTFCGGFLAGYRRTYDPLQAVLHGGVAASLAVEGVGAFYALGVLPGLPEARLTVLQDSYREV